MFRNSGFLSILIFFSACTPSERLREPVSSFFEKESIFADHFTGFSLYDPFQGKIIYEYNGDHFFTPASNTKILTLYSALTTFGDSLPAVKYQTTSDTVYVWPMADPTTLHQAFGNQARLFDFLASLNKPVVFCKNQFQDQRFGAGWAWDDYPYYYQAEKSYFPLFGNVVEFEYFPKNQEYIQYPNVLNVRYSYGENTEITRPELTNHFEVKLPDQHYHADISRTAPLHVTDSFVLSVITHYLPANSMLSAGCPSVPGKKIWYSLSVDTVYTYMMQRSDNFIAEQLLLAVSGFLTDTLQTDLAIHKMKEGPFRSISSQIQWYDGSGLSRYNLFTPNALVHILDKIRFILTEEKIRKIFAAGGVSGTIANWYRGDSGKPYIFAKTGTLKGVHCLSGYLFTDSGNMLIFSFMHNNFISGSNPVKESMNRILRFVKENY
jgi:serine-type D-Ala-D-Ala carboxypeptidase/endopeptidase (penicillin-binding protein 4)